MTETDLIVAVVAPESNVEFGLPQLLVNHHVVLTQLHSVLEAEHLAHGPVAHVMILLVVDSELLHVPENLKFWQVYVLLPPVPRSPAQLLTDVAEVVTLPVMDVQLVHVVEVFA